MGRSYNLAYVTTWFDFSMKTENCKCLLDFDLEADNAKFIYW